MPRFRRLRLRYAAASGAGLALRCHAAAYAGACIACHYIAASILIHWPALSLADAAIIAAIAIISILRHFAFKIILPERYAIFFMMPLLLLSPLISPPRHISFSSADTIFIIDTCHTYAAG